MTETIKKIMEEIEAEKKKWNLLQQLVLEINEIQDEDFLNMVIQVADAKKIEIQQQGQKDKTLDLEETEKTTETTDTKKCYRCGETKPVDEFYNNKNHADGKQNYCKPCHAKACHESKIKGQEKEALEKTKKDMSVQEKEALKKTRQDMKTAIKTSKDEKREPISIPNYSVKAQPEEVDQIMYALNRREPGYEPTTKSIMKITGIKQNRVLAILKHLRETGKIVRTLSDESGSLIYLPEFGN